MTAIPLYSRVTASRVHEEVFERRVMDFLYGSPLGAWLEAHLFRKRWFSRWYGWRQARPSSVAHIEAFVRRHGIDLSEVEQPLASFRNFNEFFTRRLKPGARPCPDNPLALMSPADARLLCHPIHAGTVVPVKGRAFTLARLLADEALARSHEGGVCLVFRLAPADYHRFAQVDDGWQSPVRRIGGHLRSVSPLALWKGLAVFTENVRECCVIESRHFGPIVEVDVGALVVGRVVQHRRQGGAVRRGEEKGYFEFGGSTVILLFRAGVLAVDRDILDQSAQGVETLVRQGEAIGRSTATGITT